MTTLEIGTKFFGWQGGTIHDLMDRIAKASPKELDNLCNSIMRNLEDITDLRTAQKILEIRNQSHNLVINSCSYKRKSS